MRSHGIEHMGRVGKGEEHMSAFSELDLWSMGKTGSLGRPCSHFKHRMLDKIYPQTLPHTYLSECKERFQI